jgi:hypothetical protein
MHSVAHVYIVFDFQAPPEPAPPAAPAGPKGTAKKTGRGPTPPPPIPQPTLPSVPEGWAGDAKVFLVTLKKPSHEEPDDPDAKPSTDKPKPRPSMMRSVSRRSTIRPATDGQTLCKRPARPSSRAESPAPNPTAAASPAQPDGAQIKTTPDPEMGDTKNDGVNDKPTSRPMTADGAVAGERAGALGGASHDADNALRDSGMGLYGKTGVTGGTEGDSRTEGLAMGRESPAGVDAVELAWQRHEKEMQDVQSGALGTSTPDGCVVLREATCCPGYSAARLVREVRACLPPMRLIA